jgi:hypothetical protein
MALNDACTRLIAPAVTLNGSAMAERLYETDVEKSHHDS